ncbi:MAG: NUDIX domain-containing protein [Pseudomonadota bacterium]
MGLTYATDNEILEIVNERDEVTGTATRLEIHRRGLMHRAVHVFVFNRAGEIYVQRRSNAKDRHPLKLDSSAAGHVDPGETYEQTAIRELHEELGIRAAVEEVLRLPASKETGQEHVVLFKTVTRRDPVPNSEEIVWGGFMSPGRLSELMSRDPNDFVPAFVLLWRTAACT